MEFASEVGIALQALARNRLTSSLTMMGICFGVGAYISSVAIGRGASSQIQQQISDLGENFIWVEAGSRNVNGVRSGTHGTNNLTVADMMAIQAQVPSVARVSPNVDARAQVVHGNRNWGTRIRGVAPDYLPIRRMRVEQGSVFSDDDVRRAAKVCVLGRTVAAQLFDDADPIGQVILIHNLPCKVLGTLETKGVSGNGQDQDDIILMPFTLVQKQIMGITWLDDIMVSAVSPEAIPAAEDDIAAVMRERHHIRDPREDDFNLRHPASVLEVGAEARKTLTLLLASIAAVALVVGGIGIMNIMLASVTERTREIGIRRAVGARRGNIVAQFLTEAVTLSLLGGGAGIALGILGAWSVGALTGWRILIEPAAVALAVGFAGAVGIFFGAYPALVAARLDPVEALGR